MSGKDEEASGMKKHELKNRKHHVDKEAQPALTAAENSSSMLLQRLLQAISQYGATATASTPPIPTPN